MASERYNWKRFWCRRDGRINLHRGYVLDPEAEHGPRLNPDVIAFQAIEAKPCLVLLGEPGIGKSDAIRAQEVETRSGISAGEDLLFVDFGLKPEPNRALFDHPKFRAWQGGSLMLHLFIDSLDECPDRGIGARLVGELRDGPIEKLRLRLACRSAELPHVVENELPGLWKEKDQVGFYELVPLRKRDIVEAAGADAEAFLAEVARQGAESLAIKPITLRFLLNLFRRHRALPKSRPELYLEGCRALCEEANDRRIDTQRVGRLRSSERLAVAARISAVSIFGRRGVLWRRIDLGDVPEDAIVEEKLCGGTERANGQELEVTLDVIRETLSITGLFTSRGPSQLGWAHQSYPEFLAAQFLVQRGMDTAQMVELVTHPGDKGKVAPELRETAAWLASIVPDIFKRIVDTDPQVLLRSDVAMMDDAARERLVDSLLDRIERREALDTDFVFHDYARKLGHGRLAEQLRPYMENKNGYFMTRRASITIAEQCRMASLQGLLADLALDPSEPSNIRASAAHAVMVLGDEATRQRLRPLVFAQGDDDADDELKGHALRALWPHLLSAAELFSSLTGPKQPLYFGSFYMFLKQPIDEHLHVKDLPVALSWVEKQPPMDDSFRASELPDRIMRKGWCHIDQPEVLAAFVHVVSTRLAQHADIFQKGYEDRLDSPLRETDRRRLVVEALLNSTPELKHEPFAITSSGLLLPEDLFWAIQQLERANAAEPRRRWARLVMEMQRWQAQDADTMELLLHAADRVEELKRELGPYSVVIDSPEAERLKESWRQQQQWQQRRRRHEEERRLDPPPEERVKKCLDRFERGDLDAWWLLHGEMTLEPTSTHYGDPLQADLTALPGWKSATEDIRARIVEAARIYLRSRDAEPERWIGTTTLYHSAIAGYRSLRLLLTLQPNDVAAWSQEIWQRWVSIIIGYPTTGGDDLHRRLVALAYQNAPEEFLWCLGILINAENATCNRISITGELSQCWDDRVGSLLLAKASDPELKSGFFGSLLDELLEKEVSGARAYAASLLQLPIPVQLSARTRAHAAAHALLTHPENAGWPTLFAVFQQDPAFGREVFLTAVEHIDRHRPAGWVQRFREDDVADLYLWLAREFPRAEDTPHQFDGHAHAVGPREMVGDLRDGLLQHLTMLGTPASLAAMDRLRLALPDRDEIAFALIRARESTLQQTWRPLQPEQIIALMPRLSAPQASPPSPASAAVASQGEPGSSSSIEAAPLFAWIQLSDIHAGHGAPAHQWDQRLVIRALCRDIGVALSEGVPAPDVLLITGDIAFSATKEQYATATEWIKEAAKIAGLDAARVFVIPGNHDADWNADKDRGLSRLLGSLHRGDEELDTALDETSDREFLARRFQTYLAFSTKFAPACVDAAGVAPEEHIFGWSHRHEARGGLAVRLLGLNTALLSAKGEDRGRLRLGKRALASLLTIQDGELGIVLSHHPLQGDWLVDELEARRWLQGHAHAHLSGHVHDANSEETRSGGSGPFVRVTAGAVHGEREAAGVPACHGYNFAAVVPGAAPGELVLRVWPRRFSDKNKEFRADVDNLPRGRPYAEHRLRLTLRSVR